MSLNRRDSLELLGYYGDCNKDSIGFLLYKNLTKENEIGYKPFELVQSIVIPSRNLDEIQDSIN